MLYPETCVTVLIAENHTTCFMCKNMPMDYMDTHVKNVLTKKKRVEMTKTIQELENLIIEYRGDQNSINAIKKCISIIKKNEGK